MQQNSLWEDQRMSLKGAIELSIASLNAYGANYRHWAIAYSGGKDSSATAAFVVWAIENKLVPQPETLTVLYADTRQELPALNATAQQFMGQLNQRDWITAKTVLPDLDNRFYVYMLGRGVPPPSNTFRWCTHKIKIDPMMTALEEVFTVTGEKFLQITGVRLGESAARDSRIAVSCSKDSGECGQGWFQSAPSNHAADTLAPLLHWRTCFVWDWLFFYDHNEYTQRVLGWQGHGFDCLKQIAVAYGDGETRTGCVGCNLASKDTALENLIGEPQYAHLAPLKELKPMFAEMKKPRHRKRKSAPSILRDGTYSKNAQRMGPLTPEAREYFLGQVLDIQQRAQVDLINAEEEARIRELIALRVYPEGWSEADILADVLLEPVYSLGHELVVQPFLV